MPNKYKIFFALLISILLITTLKLFQIFQIESAAPKQTEEWIHLNFNENPYGFSPNVLTAMQTSLQQGAVYPDDDYDTFVNSLASYHSIKSDQLLVENGLSAVLRTVAETFIGDKKTLIIADPTYELIADYAEERGSKIIKIPLKDNFSHDLDGMLSFVDSSTKLIYISNPNNPTGSITSRDEIEIFLKKLPKDVYLFIDEAYHHFAVGSLGYHSFIDEPINDDRLIVGRSFSKAYGLAGLRLGYAFSTPSTIAKLKKHQGQFGNNTFALNAGLAALKDESWMRDIIKKHHEIREEFYRQAKIRGLKYIPTEANFIMLETDGPSIKSIIEHFAKHKILIGREFPTMDKHLRISFGQPEDMEYFWFVWDLLHQTSENIL